MLSLRRAVAVVAALVVATASVTGCTTGEDAVAQGGTFDFVSPGGQTAIFYDPPSARGTIGDLSGPDLFTDEPIRLSDFTGKVVLINVWGSWCAPCRTEFPLLLQAAHDLPDVTFLAISSDSDRAKAEKMLADVGATQPPANLLLAWDPQKTVTYDVFLTAAFPETIILDTRHRQRRKIANVVAWDDPAIRNYLRDLVKN